MNSINLGGLAPSSSANVTNVTNGTVFHPENVDPWIESGAMVYVALTVATFSAVMMCCTWFLKEQWSKTTTYSELNVEEQIELKSQLSQESEEDIPLGFDTDERSLAGDESETSYTDSVGGDQHDEGEPDESAFTLEIDLDDDDDDLLPKNEMIV